MTEPARPVHEGWTLHPRLLLDSIPIVEHDDIQFRLVNDRRFVWVLVIPMHPGAEQLHRLPPKMRENALRWVDATCATLDEVYDPERVNVAAIGNVVEQLHIHCVARFSDDPAWPGVVWGFGEREPAEPLELLGRVRRIAAGLANRHGRHS
ncbi:HIT family protein [Guyparkeria sp.]|uniref:HIT family protein n=1 Tax=Guyparkeria sp. TaxID=2035736 RepID=UPI0035615967